MTSNIGRRARAAALGVIALIAVAHAGLAAGDPGVPVAAFDAVGEVPPALAVPANHRLIFEATVIAGVQTYQCGADGKYSLLGPTAMLRGREGQHAAHYFGPSWQYQDGSVVVGKAMAKAPRASTIDQLLIQVVQHDGRAGLFSDVAFIQRLATAGGAAPSQCDPVHDTALAVAYSAIYRFWAPAK